VKAIYWGVKDMLRRAAALAVLLTVGAASASLAGEGPLLGDWARGDGKTRIRVASCGAAICARNTWVRRGVSGEKVGDPSYSQAQAGRRSALVGEGFRSTA
jgi:uncharacterized protein (DUF2147 family)